LNAQAATEQPLHGLIISGGRPDFESRIAVGLGLLPAESPAQADFVICDLDQADFETARRDALAIGKPLCLVIPGPLPLHSKTTPSSFSYVLLKATILTRYENAAEAAIRALLAGALQAGRTVDTSILNLWRALPPADDCSPRRQEADLENRALQILMETGELPEEEQDGFWRILAEACSGSRLELDRVVGPVLQKNTAWFEPYHQRLTDGPAALETLHLIETCWVENDQPVHCVGTSPGSHPIISAAFTGIGGPVSFHDNEAEALAAAAGQGGVILSADRRTSVGLEQACRDKNIGLLRVDENFSRFAGLDPFFPPAAMLAADDLGAHDDASRPSRLETLLQNYDLNAREIQNGKALLDKLARVHASTVGPDKSRPIAVPNGRRIVLVPGEAISADGAAADMSERNLQLVRRARDRNPDAFIIFKPHPDLEADRTFIREVGRLADFVAKKADLSDLIGQCDAMETFSSASGFAALLRGVPVAVHGLPFYAGWGLTEDLTVCARRTTKRTLAELVYLTLAVYARCTDPVSMLPCPPEVLLDRATTRQQEMQRPARSPTLNPISWLGRKLGL
jgi:capsular polysaccharide export protein